MPVFLKDTGFEVQNMIRTKTSSPWIYSKIAQTQIVRKKIPARMVTSELAKSFSGRGALNESQQKRLKVEYFLELNHLMPMNDQDLRRWEFAWNTLQNSRSGHALDRLYQQKPIVKK